MAWKTKEMKDKFLRIKELQDAGFNVPRMHFVRYGASLQGILSGLEWAAEIHEKDPEQIFNIRTYGRVNRIETLQTEHITDIAYYNLAINLLKGLCQFNCMIDAETPDNGRYAGNVIIYSNELGRRTKFAIEYCQKNIRAMVRDHDQSLEGMIHEVDECKDPLGSIVKKALKFRPDVILEWTIFSGPAGVKREETVFWEYRKYE